MDRKTTTFVAGLRCNEISAPCVLDDAMNGHAFLTYVAMVLVPSLPGRRIHSMTSKYFSGAVTKLRR